MERQNRSMQTDMYQLTMAYAYWRAGTHEQHSVFDLFFRKSPFGGEYTLFVGLIEVLDLLSNFHFSDVDIAYLGEQLPTVDKEFFVWLKSLDCSRLKVFALKDGSVCFPRVPMIRVEGPLALCQLLETPLLNVCNFSSLVATNAARMRQAAGKDKQLLEFGLRRAQGPDGALTASKYAYVGGFDATSNVLAGQLFGIPIKGTHAHSFVQSFSSLQDLHSDSIRSPSGVEVPFVSVVVECRVALGFTNTNEGELAAFIAYAQAFPESFLALVDTYDTLQSGVPNFCCVAWALQKIGYVASGIRLDSGDLAYLSVQSRKMFENLEKAHSITGMSKLPIVVSNDLNEETLYSLNQQGHAVDAFGIGTHLVTCQSQPALGAVYKLVELNGKPRIKLSNAVSKVSIPGKKEAYRIYGVQGIALIDVMIQCGETPPIPGQRYLCREPFDATKRVFVSPVRVENLHCLVWDGAVVNPIADCKTALQNARNRVQEGLATIRIDIKRGVNPTPYKVSVSEDLYKMMHDLWQSEQPVAELS